MTRQRQLEAQLVKEKRRELVDQGLAVDHLVAQAYAGASARALACIVTRSIPALRLRQSCAKKALMWTLCSAPAKRRRRPAHKANELCVGLGPSSMQNFQ